MDFIWVTRRTSAQVNTIFNLCPDMISCESDSELKFAERLTMNMGLTVCNTCCLAMIQARLEFGNVLANC